LTIKILSDLLILPVSQLDVKYNVRRRIVDPYNNGLEYYILVVVVVIQRV